MHIPKKCSTFAAQRLILKQMTHPNLYIIAGPNGAGKTTASYTLLPEMLGCTNFVNADEIARGLSPFSPETVDVQAARIMLARIEELLAQKVDFAIETTLATRSYVQLVKRAQKAGYKVHLLFFCLESPEQAILRVAQPKAATTSRRMSFVAALQEELPI